MALQHLYSRVPAKISMFNRADSFDTFGRSPELDRQFIEKELGLYADIRLTAKENTQLRMEGLEPLYFQYQTKSGELVQSCASFISSDYTGERSSYMIHSLILDEEEQKKVFGTTELNCFEPALFEKDINKFNIAGPGAEPLDELPTVEYAGSKSDDLSWLEDVNENTLKRFVYVCTAALCGKVKSVYFTLANDEPRPSELALKYMNSFMELLPYHLRPYVSFVTSLNNQQRFTGIKIKCATAECGMVQAVKGVMISLRNGNFLGFKDEDVAANYLWVEFLCSLVSDDHTRREFLSYCKNAVEKIPALAAPTIKNLNDLVFMFKVSSGLYDELTILPDDNKLTDFFDVYDKYRKALTDQYRINALKCLKRYPENYKEIPKKVFSKISKIYHTEPYCAKAVILDVVLDLIHTDVMRDKLFTFIKNNYADEEEGIKEKISEDLCRVYYGGFLMPQILEFFTNNFAESTDKTKLDIVSKLVLTVRTKSVREELFNFFTSQYDNFTGEAKDVFYDALLENLGDGDEISARLLDILNSHIYSEPTELQNSIKDQIRLIVEKEERRKAHPLTNLLVIKGGFGSDIVSEKVFAKGFESDEFKEYVRGVCSGTVAQRSENIISTLKNGHNLSEDDTKAFLSQCKAVFGEGVTADVYEISDAENNMILQSETLENSDIKEAVSEFAEEVFPALVMNNAKTFLSVKTRLGGAEFVKDYADSHKGSDQLEGFEVVHKYLMLRNASETNSGAELAEALDYFLMNKSLRISAADYFALDADKTQPAYNLVISVLKKGTADIQALYGKLNQTDTGEPSGSEQDKAKESVKIVLELCKGVESTETCEVLQQIFAPERCGLGGILASVVSTYGKAGKKMIEEAVAPMEDCACKTFALKQLASLEPPKTGLFDNLFKKKK